MITLNNIGAMKKCNLWINEKPNIEYECIKKLEEVIIKNEWVKWGNISYVIELNLKHRHSSNYVLLGISYKYEDTKKLVIRVNSSIEDGEIVGNTLVSNSDEVHAGIPLEYSEEVIRVANTYLNSIDCSSGTITFDIGAHGYIGSSSAIFGVATEVLLKILSTDNKGDTQRIEETVFNQLTAKNQ
ncbi:MULTISPECIES: hypothetical protein [Clostridium]|uniref:hypothetical protein n=1 Tax=Clostridium TaxID=1485 RepID=UPI000CF61B40|nr:MULTISPECIES: hypothetical protein [Clostridium]